MLSILVVFMVITFQLASSNTIGGSNQFPLTRRGVFRRQTTNCDNADVFSTNSITCDPRYGQVVVDDAAECGLRTLLTQQCSKNENGQFCYEVLQDPENEEPSYFSGECDDAPFGSCTTACRNALLAHRNAFGCCVNVSVESIPFGRELWSACDVDIPDVCEESTLESTQINDKNNCSVVEFIYLFIEDYACAEAGQIIHDNLIACGNTTEADALKYGYCGKNENGDACYEKLPDCTDIDIDCILENGDSVSETCCSALLELQSCAGCCAFDEDFDDYYWSACGLEAPERCTDSVLSAANNNLPFVLALQFISIFTYMIF